MKAEFLRDENNNVWLSNVRDVHYRVAKKMDTKVSAPNIDVALKQALA
jgi:hypothetical protein